MGNLASKEASALPIAYYKEEENKNEVISELQKSELWLEYLMTHGLTKPTSVDLPDNKEQSKWTFGDIGDLLFIHGCNRNLALLSNNISFLQNTTNLILCCNYLHQIPDEIGYMKNLVQLSVENNQLTTLPETIGYLTKLVEFRASKNKLSYIPISFGCLKQLNLLDISDNCLEEIPTQLGLLKKLQVLELSRNQLKLIPEEVIRLVALKSLNVTDCPLLLDPNPEIDRVLFSLKELSARVVVRHQIPLPQSLNYLRNYIQSSNVCTFCGGILLVHVGPYFLEYESRTRLLLRGRKLLPVASHLCINHWETDAERIKLQFCPLPSTAPVPYTPKTQVSISPFLKRKVLSVSSQKQTLRTTPSLPSLPDSPKISRKKGLISRLSTLNLRGSKSMTF